MELSDLNKVDTELALELAYDQIAELVVRNANMNDLTERLHRAVDQLGALLSDPCLERMESVRLRGKIEGVKLALSYIEEERNAISRSS